MALTIRFKQTYHDGEVFEYTKVAGEGYEGLPRNANEAEARRYAEAECRYAAMRYSGPGIAYYTFEIERG